MSLKGWLLRWLRPHEWSLMIGRTLFFRCKKCGAEYHGSEFAIRRAFIHGPVPIERACK
jgi:hypothetical protein